MQVNTLSQTHTHLYTHCFLSPACNCGWRRVETGRKSNLNFLQQSDPPQRHSMARYPSASRAHTPSFLPIVRRSSSHWLMWGSFSISFHFLLRPFLFPPPPKTQRDIKSAHQSSHCFSIALLVFNPFQWLAFSTQEQHIQPTVCVC